MPELLRPPQKIVDAIMTDVLMLPEPTTQIIEKTIRRHLAGTRFRYPKSHEMVAAYRAQIKKERRLDLEKLLRGKVVRTDSGVAPITLLTKPYACPGKCVYCPTEARMPKSYVASEPAAARALRLNFDPYAQVKRRIQALEANGHEAKKIELIIKGGTWSAYPWTYRQWFVKRCFDAANHLGQVKRKRFATLAESQTHNETTDYRIIGITIETRPDLIFPKELIRLRELGVTRVELGVQAIDDAILLLTKRGHDVDAVVRATVLLKATAFKTDYHFLPGQPGSNPQKDVDMFKQLFDDPRFRPDMVKIYPCVVIPSAELAEWHKAGKFKPLEGEALIEAMIKMKSIIPRYCRISRLIRDFPSNEISAGNAITNLRDVIKDRMKQRGLVCNCLRCREAGHREPLPAHTSIKVFSEEYENAGGQEIFLSVEDEARTTVLAFLRLRFPSESLASLDEKTKRFLEESCTAFPELHGAAFVRELHTYGQALKINEDKHDAIQHKGWGRRLMEEAERLAKQRGYESMAVISGIGVREYYRSLGYRLVGTYMKKQLW